jgi:hypothetical protein
MKTKDEVKKSGSRGVEKSGGRGLKTTASSSDSLGVALAPRLFDSRLLDFQNLTNDPGMSLKTKGRCGKLGNEAGMLLIIKAVSRQGQECYLK